MSSSCVTEPSEFRALTAHLSGSEARALLERALDAQGERERQRAPRSCRPSVRAWREREQELLEQLTALLDDALRVVRELAP